MHTQGEDEPICASDARTSTAVWSAEGNCVVIYAQNHWNDEMMSLHTVYML